MNDTAHDRPFRGFVLAAALGIIFWLAAGALCVLANGFAGPGAPARPYVPATAGTGLVQRAALVVNLERVDPAAWGGWDGECPGTARDAAVALAALRERGIPALALADEEATVEGVLAAARQVGATIRPGGLLMLYFSGHGGQRPGAPEEEDGFDETLCLYDGALSDDTVWELLRLVPAGVRVWLVTDCCNSGTNFRAPPHDYARGVSRWYRAEPDLLHWGAAVDGTSALGSWRGGFFTRALQRAWRPGITYREWFDAAKPLVLKKQTPVSNHTGADFSDREAFQ